MLSGLIVPGCLLATLLAAACRRLPAYDLFVEGAREGIAVAVRVLPNLAAMLVAIGLMQASGLMDALCRLAAPAFEWLGLPGEVAPLVLLRPMSRVGLAGPGGKAARPIRRGQPRGTGGQHRDGLQRNHLLHRVRVHERHRPQVHRLRRALLARGRAGRNRACGRAFSLTSAKNRV